MPNTNIVLTPQALMQTLQAQGGTLAVTQAQVLTLVAERDVQEAENARLMAEVMRLTVELAAAQASANGAKDPVGEPTPIR